jgi:hypothetical protein
VHRRHGRWSTMKQSPLAARRVLTSRYRWGSPTCRRSVG